MESRRIGIWLIVVVAAATISFLGTTYCFGVGPFARGRTKLVISTTTSLYDTKLLDEIEDQFEAEYPIDIYFVSAGTGIAITYAQRGDADMILVHAPSKERKFLEDGYGVCRKIVAYNFFTIVGPDEDPVNLKDLTPTQTLAKIVETGRKGEITWVSRGDDSGTHTKEKEFWAAAGFESSALRDEDWYIESGTGMGKTLQIASEKSAYTLADMGTYLKYFTDQLIDLEVVVDVGKELLNVYSAIVVNRTFNSEVNFNAAMTFLKFLISEEGQQIIDNFGQGVHPQKLFYPAVQLLKNNMNTTLANWIEEFTYFDGKECPEDYQDGYEELYNQ